MMMGMLNLGRAGLLEGALTSNERFPYTLDNTKAMLFFQEDVDQNVADGYDMKGTQWGITHEVGNLPGPWWLWPYAIWYQIPPLTSIDHLERLVRNAGSRGARRKETQEVIRKKTPPSEKAEVLH
jgi:hypothetical protein